MPQYRCAVQQQIEGQQMGESEVNQRTMEYQDMRTDAWCGVMMVEFLKQHNRAMDKIIAEKMGASTSITNPCMVSLATLLDAYMPAGFKIQDTRQIDLCLRVLANKVREIDFEVVE